MPRTTILFRHPYENRASENRAFENQAIENRMFENQASENRAFENRAVGFRVFRIRASTLFLFAVMVCFLMNALPVRAQVPGVVSGIVLAPDGSPQTHARVYLQPGNGRPPRTVLTDETGHFTFAKVANGMYDVRAQGNGLWSDLYRNVSVKKNDEVTVKLQLKVALPKPAKP
jgi:hypothetical protein